MSNNSPIVHIKPKKFKINKKKKINENCIIEMEKYGRTSVRNW